MIKIIKDTRELSAERLNELEAEGMTLISANCAVTSEYGKMSPMGMSYKHDVTRWTYHFRFADEKLHGDRGRKGVFS
jgi:hypothetical protein